VVGPVGVPFWKSLGGDDRDAVRLAGRTRRFARDEVLCRQGQQPAEVFVLLSGQVEVFQDDRAGHRTVLARRGAGDVIGELSALDGHRMSATVTAVEPTAALAVPASRFTELCRTRPEIGWLVTTNVVTRLRDSDTHRTQHRGTVRDRTVLALLELVGGASARPPGARSVELHLTQQALADMVSASLVSVTRVLDELRGDGTVWTRRGRIVVRDVAALRRAVDTGP